MSYVEIPHHRLLPRTIIDEYKRGFGSEVTNTDLPEELLADLEYYTERPHMLSQFVVKKWFEQGLLNGYAEHRNLELVNRR